MAVSLFSTETATMTESSPTQTISTLAMTTRFTPPTDCATSWTYEPYSYNSVAPSGLIMQNCNSIVRSCFPSGFAGEGRKAPGQIYSPGYCPMGYTSADVAIKGPVTSAICCLSDYSYTASVMHYSNLPSATYAGCTSELHESSSTIVSARAKENNRGTQVQGPIVMWAQPITIQLEASDLSLFVPVTSTTESSSEPTPTPKQTSSDTTRSTGSASSAAQPSQDVTSTGDSGSSGLSTGAKAGIGIGAAVGGVAILGVLAFWLFRRRSPKKDANLTSMETPYYDPNKAGPPTYVVPRNARGPPVELDNSEYGARKYMPELQG
ncbi:hypothetical protein P170DRAFT_426923 [Aspergillus steynii IBT 23096]|uniref:Mid2 domain-containing protein n=1 Tax=Aspergillus steynii IBT 23096 TaxID=1392250 RepID=A0A2I2G492_9EURO|nr:uncharacterized protein P170DRAFT_426923 [Aspergillus steynii IBT 23096]PLB47692.1 hypothetical protein P170DRAFT_426923 [Aspergillus steynii IBT 23096]